MQKRERVCKRESACAKESAYARAEREKESIHKESWRREVASDYESGREWGSLGGASLVY
jgi:hypothetical protein